MKRYMNKFIISGIACLAFTLNTAHAQMLDTTVVIDEVVVSAGKVPFSLSEVPRSVTVISAEELKNAPVQNIQDLLSNYNGIDIKKRGPEGVQADVSVRGGTFEQTLIMIDGVKLSDPQTGHHNLNLPINFDDVERIEIIKGQASSIYGPNALAGAINIISKKGNSRKVSANLSGGGSGYYQGSLSIHQPIGSISNIVSVSKSKSDGYRNNTSFDILTSYLNSSYQFNSGNAALSLGYTEKKFGANGFYSDKFPNQWEETKTFLSSAAVNYALSIVSISPKVFWRNNKDYYLLDYTRPSFYKNNHETNSFGGELQTVISTGIGSIALGGEYITDDIKSSSLGNHNRNKGGFSGEIITSPVQNLKVVVGGFAYYYDTFGMKLWPGIDLGYQFSRNFSAYASAGKSFRIPSFTDLFYSSPAQVGNSSLQPEESATYESGVNFFSSAVSANAGVFYRKGTNLIDWVRETSDKPWKAQNIASLDTKGIDAAVTFLPDAVFDEPLVKKVKLSYSYLDSEIEKTPLQSRYVLDHLKHQLVGELTHILPLNSLMTWVFRYADRFNQDSYFVTDAKISTRVLKYEVFVEASNLFNHSYLDISGIPMPGRWIKAGINIRFENF